MTNKVASSPDVAELIRPVIKTAYLAGQRIMEVYDKGFSIAEKSDNTPLTEADLAANSAILTGLKVLTPDLPILSEESEPPGFTERSSWSRYWLTDPLDGTREFIRRSGEFCVNIALIDNRRAILGVVYAPVLGSLYYAAQGLGAYKKTGLEEAQRIQVQSECSPRIRVAASHASAREDFHRFLRNIGEYEIVRMGSALKSCLVAEGTADIYARLGPTSEWDTAAAQCIVEEAGGHLTDTHIQPLRYNTKENLLNPHFLVFGDQHVDWSKYL